MKRETTAFQNRVPATPRWGDPAAQGQEPEFKNWKEHLYDKVHLSVRTLDIIIGVLVALIFVFILLGMLKTRLG